MFHSGAVNSITDAYGGPWKHTLFLPLFMPSRQPPTLHIMFTVWHQTGYVPPFEDAAGFLRYTNNRLPEANHFVPLSNDNASAVYANAVDKFRNLRTSAQQAERAASRALFDATMESQDGMTPEEQEKFLDGLAESSEQV